jgi:ferredoxin-thioredoxin reductase catalytic subunit/rubredoxin
MSAEERFSDEVLKTWERLKKEAEETGYRLNPDKDFTLRLVQSLLENEKRYGYWCCPCRLAFGERNKDLDVICPCYYRDSDVEEFGACYCALYVSDDWISGKKKHGSIPERRPAKFMRDGYSESPPPSSVSPSSLPLPVWRCKVCGYLCARPEPPGKCPVCKAGKDRFERFM